MQRQRLAAGCCDAKGFPPLISEEANQNPIKKFGSIFRLTPRVMI